MIPWTQYALIGLVLLVISGQLRMVHDRGDWWGLAKWTIVHIGGICFLIKAGSCILWGLNP